MDWKALARQSLNVRTSSAGEWAATRFYGDPKVASAYLPVAHAILGAVKNQMALGGITYGHRKVELPNGTVIRVLRNFEQNIIEITTTLFEESFTTSGGSNGFIFYPKTKTKSLGIYPPGTRAVYYPLPKEDPPWLPFATLAYQYVKEDNKFDLSAQAPMGTQAGNQFFFAENGVVYSWWHSPYGDGPLTRYDNKNVSYAPFLNGTSLAYYTAKGDRYVLRPIVYMGGVPWFLVPAKTEEILAGFWAGPVKVEEGVFIQRYIAALYSMRCQVIIKVFENPRASNNGMFIMDLVKTDSTPLIWGGSNINVSGNSVSWPIKIASTGDKAALILANDSDPSEYDKNRANQMVVAEISIVHQRDTFSYHKAQETVYPMGMQRRTYQAIYRGNWVRPKAATGAAFHRFDATVGSQYAKYGYKYEFIGASDQYPVALSYTALDELHIAFLELDKGEYFIGSEASATVNLDVAIDEYNRSPDNKDKVYIEQVYTAKGEGFARESYGNPQRANSNFSLVDNNSKVLIPKIKTESMAKNEITGTLNWENMHYLNDTFSNPAKGINNATYIRNTVGNQKSSGLSGAGYIRFINLSDEVLLYYTLDSSGGNYNHETRYNYSRDDINSTWPGTYHREIENRSDYTTTYGASQELGISLFLTVKDKQHEYTDSARASSDTSSEAHHDRYDVNGVTIRDINTGEYYSIYPNIMSYGIYETCNINGIAVPNIPGTWDDSAEIVGEADISASAVIALFFPGVPIEFSYARDKRISEKPVWAYGLKFSWTLNFRDPKKGIIELKLEDIKTDSTFGALTQHIFLLDEDGNITDQPINDPTLTVHPIGLY